MGIPKAPKKYTTGTTADKFITQRSNRRGEHKNVPLSIDAVKNLLGINESVLGKIEEYDIVEINIGSGREFPTLLEANTYIADNPQLKYIWVKVWDTTGGTLNISNRDLVKHSDFSVGPTSEYNVNMSEITRVSVTHAVSSGSDNANKLFTNCGDITFLLYSSINTIEVESCNNIRVVDQGSYTVNTLKMIDTQSAVIEASSILSLILDNSNCYIEAQTVTGISYSGKSTLTQGVVGSSMPVGYEYTTILYDLFGVLEYYYVDSQIIERGVISWEDNTTYTGIKVKGSMNPLGGTFNVELVLDMTALNTNATPQSVNIFPSIFDGCLTRYQIAEHSLLTTGIWAATGMTYTVTSFNYDGSDWTNSDGNWGQSKGNGYYNEMSLDDTGIYLSGTQVQELAENATVEVNYPTVVPVTPAIGVINLTGILKGYGEV